MSMYDPEKRNSDWVTPAVSALALAVGVGGYLLFFWAIPTLMAK